MAKAYTPISSDVPKYTAPIDLVKGSYVKKLRLFYTRGVAVLPAIETINPITNTHAILRKIRIIQYAPFDAIHSAIIEIREGVDVNGILIDRGYVSYENRDIILDNIDYELYNLFIRIYRGDASATNMNIAVNVYYELV
jgi:hypothetical protein